MQTLSTSDKIILCGLGVASVLTAVAVGQALTTPQRRPPPLSATEVLDVAEDLLGQAGTRRQTFTLLDMVEASTPARDGGVVAPHLVQAAQLRCRASIAWDGPIAAVPACRRAHGVAVGQGTDETRAATWLGVALARTRSHGDAVEAAALLKRAPQAHDPITSALLEWGRWRAADALSMSAEALAHAERAAQHVEDAVRTDPGNAEYRAIARTRLATALRKVGRAPEARAAALEALRQQRGLDAAADGYAEYRLYLVRVLREVAAQGGDDAASAAAEAARLTQGLRERDPARWEYGEGL